MTDYGLNGTYWQEKPSDNSAQRQTEWKKGLFYAALAAFIQGDQAAAGSAAQVAAYNEARRRVNLGFADVLSSDMFSLSALFDLYRREPLQFTNAAAVDNAGKLWSADLRTAVWTQCWHEVGDPGRFTTNQQVMLWTVALFANQDATMRVRDPAQFGASCKSNTGTYADLGSVNARQNLIDFMNATVKYGYPEQDSATYSTYYLSMLRLIADKYTYEPALATQASMTFDWIIASMAGSFHNGDFTATTSREYFPSDGSSFRPVTLANYLRVLFGGKHRPRTLWEDAGNGLRKPWAAPAIPLWFGTYSPPVELVTMATDRSAIYTQRQVTRMNMAGTPPLANLSRYVEPGFFQLAVTQGDALGWGSDQVQDLTLHADSSDPAENENRSLTVANPKNSTSPWNWTDINKQYEPLGTQPQLQWLADGRSAVGVLEAGNAPKQLRGEAGKNLISPSWTSSGTVGASLWHVFHTETAWVGVRSLTAFNEDARNILYPSSTPDDGRFFTSQNPGQGVGSIVIVDVGNRSAYADQAAFVAALESNPVSCGGIPAAGAACTTVSSRPTVSYRNLAGKLLTIGFPANGDPQPVRSIDGVVQIRTTWPVLENPWAQQNPPNPPGPNKLINAPDDVLRVSAITSPGVVTTRVSVYTTAAAWTTTTATQTFGSGMSGRLEAWTSNQPNGWIDATWSGTASYARSSSAHTGSYAGQVSVTNGDAGFSLHANYRPTISTDRATVTAWIKLTGFTAGSGTGAYVYAQYTDSAGNVVCTAGTSAPVTSLSTGWQSRSVTLDARCAGATKLALSVRLNGTGTLLVDDIDYATHK